MGGVLHNTHTQSCAGIYWNIMTTMDRETQANIVFFSETRNYPVKFVCLTVFYHSWWHQGAYPTCLSLRKLYGGLRLLRVSFVWMTALGKILACKNLLKMDYSIMSWCCVCKCSEETVNHHLIHCCVAFELWSYVFRSFGIQWVLQVRSLTYYVGGRRGS